MKYFLLSLEELQLLNCIKNEGNLKKTSKQLHLSQSALSLQIKKLEYKLNSKIFERTTKQLTFTPLVSIQLNLF